MNSDFKPSNTTHKVLDPNAISQKSVAYYAPIRLQQIYHQTFHTIFTSRQCAMSAFNASQVDLNTASKEDVLCFLALSENDQKLAVLEIPYGVYLFARYFGTGVIVATAFIHLLDPAYKRIGPKTCVGESGYWGEYSWCAAIVLGSVMIIFLMDLAAEVYVERKYGVHKDEDATGAFIQGGHQGATAVHSSYDQEKSIPPVQTATTWTSDNETAAAERSFKQQIAAFLILEFGIIFHSVIIGLNLGVTGSEFATLYPVLVFHQSFEGLGIGARMSAIPFDKHTWLPWILCAMYGLTTPISIAIGLGVRTTYNPGSKVALIVQGVLNAISAGVLIYSGLVELLARDFLFDPDRTKRRSQLLFMVFCTLLGAGIMALIGKWA